VRRGVAGIALVVTAALAAVTVPGCGETQGTLLICSAAGEDALTPDQAQEAAAVIRRRLELARLSRAQVTVYDAVKVEVFIPSIDPIQVGDWRSFVTAQGLLEFREVLPDDAAGQTDDDAEWLKMRSGGKELMVIVATPDGIPAGAVESAEARKGEMSSWQVEVTFREDTHAAVERFTRAITGRRMAVVLDGKILVAPQVQGAITGSAIIDPGSVSGFSRAEADRLAALMASGALPVPMKIDGQTPVKR
jgi:preprotein translocase subunit SecD